MRVCIDTNVVLQLFGRSQAGRPIRDALLRGEIEWAISNEILLEYEETITRLSGRARWQEVERFITLLSNAHDNISFIEPQFCFGVVTADPDDNKFVDCAVAAQADCVITADRHLRDLATSGYKPQPITAEEFVQSHL